MRSSTNTRKIYFRKVNMNYERVTFKLKWESELELQLQKKVNYRTP